MSGSWYPATLTAGATARIVRTPPTVLITSAPTNPTNSTDANFTWTISGFDITAVECNIDGAGWVPCDAQTAQSYTNLVGSGTSHSFLVRATNDAGPSSVASWFWTIN